MHPACRRLVMNSKWLMTSMQLSEMLQLWSALWVLCSSRRDRAVVKHITRMKTSNRYLHCIRCFLMYHHHLQWLYFVLIASTPSIGHLIFRLIIRALQLASYVYLITFCVLSFRLMAVPVVNIMRKFLGVDVSSGYYICLLPNPHDKDWPVSLSCKYFDISYHCELHSMMSITVVLAIY